MRLLFTLFTVAMLSACGFHLRGYAGMPFNTLYLKAANPNSPLIADLRQNLESNKVTLVDSPERADVVLDIVYDSPDRQILSLGGSGRVSEFQLYYRVSLRAYDNQQQDWIPAVELEISRNYSFDDTQILAKESEESLLYQSMRADMARQIVRRLSHARPQPQD